jgi:hypothetical protein
MARLVQKIAAASRDDEVLSASVTGSDPASVADELSAPFRHRLGLEM